MNKNNVYVPIHSPLVGPGPWQLVVDHMRRRGLDMIIPSLKDSEAVDQAS